MTKCELCGEPMPKGEEVFKYHGYSGKCPKPPLQRAAITEQEPYAWSYTSKINGDEVLTHQPPDRVIEPEQFHIQPLYLHPAAKKGE